LILYAESSAVLTWLLGQEGEDQVRALLAEADQVFASDLTIIECERALHRGEFLGELTAAEATDRRSRLRLIADRWNVLRVTDEVVDLARRAFPVEPIRTLDALHLASAEVARNAIPEVSLLTLDERIEKNGRSLDFQVLPS
jgi:predicted nucleic acid-binding protein